MSDAVRPIRVDLVAIEDLDEPHEVKQRAREPVELVDHHAVDAASFDALRTILNSVTPKLTYRKEGDIYYISQAQEVAPTAPLLESTQQASEQQVYWIGPGGRYGLQYLDCRDVAKWFGGLVVSGTPQIPNPMGGSGTACAAAPAGGGTATGGLGGGTTATTSTPSGGGSGGGGGGGSGQRGGDGRVGQLGDEGDEGTLANISLGVY